jgi:putative membrane protein
MIYKVIAWVHALRLHLRKQDNWHELKSFLSEQEFEHLEKSQNKPNYLHLLSGKKIYEAMANGTLGGFDSFQMEGQLLALANYQGGCERIKNTPLLRQYDFFTRLFLYTFMLLLPFSLIGDFTKMNIDYLMIPVSVIISFVFAIIGKVGEVNEDPFENRITDVPLTAMCNTIERDLREMLGEKDLPKKLEAENGFLY